MIKLTNLIKSKILEIGSKISYSFARNASKKKIFFAAILIFLILIISVLSIEIFSIFLIKKLGYNWEPAYLRMIKGYKPSNLYGGLTENNSWGQWGVPNYVGRTRNNCIDVEFKYNSHGARDKERNILGKGRTLMFGDSFVEGFGVDQDKTLPAYLEEISGKEFLNFGVSGGYGPLNYYLLYKDFANKFEHESVMVGLTIGNDFTDNDTLAWLGNAQLHYHPFWKLSEDKQDFEIVYYSPKRQFVRELDPANKIPEYKYYSSWKDFSAFIRISEFIKDRKIYFDKNSTFVKKTNYNLEFSEDQIAATLIAFDKFSKLIVNQKKYIVILPSIPDVVYYLSNREQKIPKFEEFKNKLEQQGWQVIDARDAFANISTDDIPKYYIVCDGHPSVQGHKLMAEYILNYIR